MSVLTTSEKSGYDASVTKLATISRGSLDCTVRAASLPAYTISNGGNTLTANANGALPAIDGQTLSVGLSVFNADGTAGGGRFDVTDMGSGGTPWILTRSADSNTAALLRGSVIGVAKGSLYASTIWGPLPLKSSEITLGTTALSWPAQPSLSTLAASTAKPFSVNASNQLELNSPILVERWSEDFNSATTAGRNNLIISSSGTGAGITQVATAVDATHDGVVNMNAGSSGAGRSGFFSFPNTLPTLTPSSANALYNEFWVRIPTLSDGTNTFQWTGGFLDTQTSIAQGNCAAFLYNTADTHFQYINRNGSVGAAVATTVTVTAGQWYRLAARKASGANAWQYEIDGVNVSGGFVSTNAPTGKLGIGAIITSTAGASGAVLVDGFNGYKAYDSSRY